MRTRRITSRSEQPTYGGHVTALGRARVVPSGTPRVYRSLAVCDGRQCATHAVLRRRGVVWRVLLLLLVVVLGISRMVAVRRRGDRGKLFRVGVDMARGGLFGRTSIALALLVSEGVLCRGRVLACVGGSVVRVAGVHCGQENHTRRGGRGGMTDGRTDRQHLYCPRRTWRIIYGDQPVDIRCRVGADRRCIRRGAFDMSVRE